MRRRKTNQDGDKKLRYQKAGECVFTIKCCLQNKIQAHTEIHIKIYCLPFKYKDILRQKLSFSNFCEGKHFTLQGLLYRAGIFNIQPTVWIFFFLILLCSKALNIIGIFNTQERLLFFGDVSERQKKILVQFQSYLDLPY